MPKVRIVSLGEIVSQVQVKALLAFAKLINPENEKAAQGVLGKILLGSDTLKDLSDFKQGVISEEEFTKKIIIRIKEATQVELTLEQFDTAWNAMNPAFSEFASLLEELLAWNRGEQKIVLISYTNPKDMRHLKSELEAANIKHTVDENNELNSIEGMPLHLSYVAKTSKADLILQVIKQLAPPTSVTMFASASQSPHNIKYVHSINGKEDPIFAYLDEQSRQPVVAMAKTKGVEALMWDKQHGQPFNEINDDSKTTYFVLASKL